MSFWYVYKVGWLINYLLNIFENFRYGFISLKKKNF